MSSYLILLCLMILDRLRQMVVSCEVSLILGSKEYRDLMVQVMELVGAAVVAAALAVLVVIERPVMLVMMPLIFSGLAAVEVMLVPLVWVLPLSPGIFQFCVLFQMLFLVCLL